MTKEEWKQAEEALKSLFGGVKLNCDGYEVTLYLRQVSQFKNAILVYVNGVFRGKWLVEDCEERRRFFPCKKKTIVTDKDIKAIGSSDFRMTKKRIQEYKDKCSYNTYSSAWTNFKAMKKHFEANNLNIELMEAEL